ncbi:MAG: hypothetical protein IJX66_09185 [Lachnospiraceae bacterium]|nr:hypothetical protein [Lachnospiraceae bacterium]
MHVLANLDIGLTIIYNRLVLAQQELAQLLKQANHEYIKEVRQSHGSVSQANYYGLYHWLRIKTIDDHIYWITLFFNDVDKASGNIHTQPGRIQFWRDIEDGSPNKRAPDNNWIFCPEKSQSPKKKQVIDADDYDPNAVITDFINFMEKHELDKRKK